MTPSKLRRGDVVIVDFRTANPAANIRPALVVQNDRDNARTTQTIVAQVTTNTSRVREDTQLLIDPNHSDWSISGLRAASAVNCLAIINVRQLNVRRVIGSLSTQTMQEIDDCLKAALGIS